MHLNVEVGRDCSLAELHARHDAIVIATGAYKARNMSVPGIGLGNIFQAMDYLTASNRKGLGDTVPAFDDGTLDAEGKNVVVVGGGDTAMDCVRTAVRQGARSVRCLYRRDRANMPGSMQEVRHAEEEGVEFVWLSAPEAVLGNTDVEGVRAVRIHLGVADASGRQIPQPIPARAIPSTPICSSRRSASILKICRRCSASRARDDALGHAAHRLAHHDDEPRRRLRHWRHRARRLAGRLGDQGRAGRRALHSPLYPNGSG